MNERYELPKTERIKRHFPENLGLLVQGLPDGNLIDLNKDFSVTENPELGYQRFVRSEGDKVGFELLISDEATKLLNRLGKVEVKQKIKSEITQITQDPFGPSSINFRGKKPGRANTSINAFNSELEDRLGIPVAIKIPGPGEEMREDLLRQFRFMKQCAKEWQNLPNDVKKVLRVGNVYAAFRYPAAGQEVHKESLIMERIPNTKTIKTKRGERGVKGFSITDHPAIATIIEKYLKNYSSYKFLSDTKEECYDWFALVEALELLGLHLSDCNGNNFLYSENKEGQKVYTIIDQNAEFIYLMKEHKKIKRDKKF